MIGSRKKITQMKKKLSFNFFIIKFHYCQILSLNIQIKKKLLLEGYFKMNFKNKILKKKN